jgi:hypothetical protein
MMNQTIINAINNMGILSFIYKGKPRVVEPHAYGMSSYGNDLLRAYQVGGYSSSSGRLPKWRLFEVNEINNLSPTDEKFNEARPGYHSNDQIMVRIYAQL